MLHLPRMVLMPEFFFIIILIFLIIFFLLVAQSKLYYYPLASKLFIYIVIFFLTFLTFLYYNNLNLYTSLFMSSFNVSLDLSLLKIVIIVFSIFSLILSLDFLKTEKINDFEYIILILFSIFGIVVLVSANDLLITYIAIEVQSLSLYILVSFKRNTLYSTEAGLKYFILGSLASILLLFGFSSIYGIFGTINFNDLALILSFDCNITLFLLFPTLYILVGLLFKLTIVPFHFWAADVYEGSPSSITLYMLVVPKLSLLIMFIHFFLIVYNSLYIIISPFLVFFSVLSMVVGSFLSLKQKKFKRLFVYSSITHMGFLFLSLSLLTLNSFHSFFLYFFLYVLMSLCI